MKYSIDLAHALIPYPNKGEDACCVRRLDEDRWLLAVADGLTMNEGGDAARWAIEHLSATTATASPRALIAELKRQLAAQAGTRNHSRTTLTAGLLSLVEDSYEPRLHFDFFGIGDSPVWCVVRSDDPEFPYQRHSVYGSIYPSLTARVYATLHLAEGDVIGKVSFGSVDVGPGEVLVVCSDGVPERSILARDFLSYSSSEQYERLCEWLFRPDPYNDEALFRILRGYLERGSLSDDASLIVARLRPLEAPPPELAALPYVATSLATPDASHEVRPVAEENAGADILSNVSQEEAPNVDTGELAKSEEFNPQEVQPQEEAN